MKIATAPTTLDAINSRSPARAARISPARRFLGQFNAAAGLLLLIAGGMVTSTASGMAVPDWPLSYGRWLPSMVGGIFYEHGHRMFAGTVGFLILINAFWTQFEDERPGVRRLGWWTLGLVSLQGVLGGVTVWFNLPAFVSAAHATLGQTVFLLLVIMAELVGEGARPPAAPSAGRVRWLGAAAVLALWLQLFVGAVMRHGGAGISWHLCGAVIASLTAGSFGAKVMLARREPTLAGPATALLALLCTQILLGVTTADFRTVPLPRANYAMIAVATTHLAVGAFLLGVTALLAFRLFRLEA
jgi:cytochrome c oxidase assembly protein subunit 15